MEEILIRLFVSGGPSALIMAGGLFWLNYRIKTIQADVSELKSGKRWTETCEATHMEVNRRLDRIENLTNNIL